MIKKKYILTFIIVMTIPSMVIGFDFSIGFKAGLAVSSYGGSDYEQILDDIEALYEAIYGDDFDFQSEPKAGLSLGIYATIGLHPNIAIQPEILFTSAGGAYGWDETINYYGGTTYETIKLFEFPVLIVGRIRLSNFFGFNLFAGPNLGIRVGKVKWETVVEGEKVADGEMDEEYANSIFGLVFGAGITIYTYRNVSCSIDARYSLGLTPVVNEDEFGVDDWKQNNIQFMLSFGTMLKGKKALRSRVR